MFFTTNVVHPARGVRPRSPHVTATSGRRDPLKCRATLEQIAPGEYQSDTVWVLAPKQRPKAVIHLTGGAFAAAAPNLVYPLLSHLLSNAGYTIIATPFAVTFQHAVCAAATHTSFFNALQDIQTGPLKWMAPPGTPTVGVGHSNGALLQLLMGAQCTPLHDAAVVMSYNNREVGGAIPVPLDTLKPVADGIAATDASSLIPDPIAALETFTQPLVAAGMLAGAQVPSLAPLVGQLRDVFGEVGNGIGDFTPTPSESRAIIAARYAVPRTLLVQFQDDSIDQTQEMAGLLMGDSDVMDGGVSSSRTTDVLQLPGTHITPCGGDLTSVQGVPLLQPLASGAQGDIRRLVGCMTRWLDDTIQVHDTTSA